MQPSLAAGDFYCRAELAGTRVLRLALDEAVAKIRNWGVEDDADDLALPVWAGVIPVQLQTGAALAETGCATRLVPALPAFLQQARGCQN